MITVSNREFPELSWKLQETRVAQNVRNLLSLLTGEAAYARNMGLDAQLLHRPTKEAKALLAANARAVIEKYEPDALVLDVRVLQDEKGRMYVEADLGED